MAFSHSPKIVTDGLILCLDAGNPKSYPGTGTTWKDLSGNGNNGTLTNGPTFDSGNGGAIVFDGTNDYIQTAATNLSANVGTISTWVKTEFSSTDAGSYYIADTRDLTNTNNISLYYLAVQGGFVVYGNTSIIFTTSRTFSSGTYFMLTLTYDFLLDNYALYINGTLVNSSTSAKSSSGAITKITLGSRFNQAFSEFWNGNISLAHLYNRALTASEVLQNYNATKGRFGL